ncbi:CLIP-associated protein-like [Quillaja saponaria]|uniref:CLIP-associated protein-like n=1 Tax=Quillaja saponaria TaxID=32244 RepID=A0AAD7VE76_QUISA|nr:CLIP-associated protein-like [Quillaja saponaria]
MQRVEALVYGGAVDYPCFRGLLKQLVGPLSTQLSDRRSSIVKQACHLLCFLSKELLGDFESCAEMFIPVLFKLVVITVLVIAESADNCIKTMLRNCKVPRVLPRIADCAKNDRNAVLRARCCEYALLILEHWPDAPEIQRSAELYEDLIRCCVADAMSGGVALLYASKELDKLQTTNFDQKIGVQIIQNALKMPVYIFASNAGVEGAVVVGKLLEQDNPDLGYNAAKGEYVDMIKAGMVDPLKVIRTALGDAASVPSLMTTTEAAVVELAQDEKESPAMGAGMDY